MAEEVTKIYSYGVKNFMTRELNAKGDGYDADPVKWIGSMEINITVSQTRTAFAADNDPKFVEILSAPTATGTIFIGLRVTDYEKIMSVVSAAGKGVRFGEDLPIKYFGLSFDEETSDGENNKFILYKNSVSNIPAVVVSTVSGDALTLRDVTLNIESAPVFYNKADGGTGRVIYDIINKVADAARWAENEDTILYPYELTAETAGG